MQENTSANLNEPIPSQEDRAHSRMQYNSTYRDARGIKYDAFKFPPDIEKAKVHAVI